MDVITESPSVKPRATGAPIQPEEEETVKDIAPASRRFRLRLDWYDLLIIGLVLISAAAALCALMVRHR